MSANAPVLVMPAHVIDEDSKWMHSTDSTPARSNISDSAHLSLHPSTGVPRSSQKKTEAAECECATTRGNDGWSTVIFAVAALLAFLWSLIKQNTLERRIADYARQVHPVQSERERVDVLEQRVAAAEEAAEDARLTAQPVPTIRNRLIKLEETVTREAVQTQREAVETRSEQAKQGNRISDLEADVGELQANVNHLINAKPQSPV
jgi:hypothetical protein